MSPYHVCCVLSALQLVALAFNVDTSFPVVFSGPNENSYFGFSVALLRSRNRSRVLVTATRANSTRLNAQLHQPGVLYRCDVSSTSCTEVLLDMEGNTFTSQGPDFSYKDKKDDMWLGVSLDVQQGGQQNVVTCGHLWKNQHFRQHYLANGVCYVINSDLSATSVKKLVPFVQKSKQSIIPPGIYYYAFGQVGFSAHFTADGNNLLLGAPGFYDWMGTVVSYDSRQLQAPVVPEVPNDQNPSPEAYIGYSVTSGKFFNGGKVFTAVGAPRGANNRGMVYIYENVRNSRPRISVEQKKEGQQMGEYFGAAVLAVNFNDDSFTDLLVGAPFHSLPLGSDEGRVYVFVSDGVGLQEQQELVSLQKYGARFGTTLASLGDINQDTFNDVAVGAPYEDGRGAVYIYQGTASGVNPQFSQRIVAADAGVGVSGFGISIARGEDIDNNGYKDLLVGAYSSSHAILFRTSPVVQVWPKLTFDPPQININSSNCRFFEKNVPCINVTSCVRYTGKNISEIMDFQLTLEIDTSRQKDRSPRGYIIHGGVPSVLIRRKEELDIGVEGCFQNEAHFPAQKQDIITPISFTLKFEIVSDVPRGDTFCSHCPVLDQSIPNFVTRELAFQAGCGSDNICTSDLKLKAVIPELRKQETLVVGRDVALTLIVEVRNDGEPAYAADVHVFLPSEVQLVNQADCLNARDVKNSETTATLVCPAGNPLQRGQTATFVIKLSTAKVPTSAQSVVIYLEAATVSQKHETTSDKLNITVPFKALADISIQGLSDQEQILYGGDGPTPDIIQFVQTYVVVKSQPSPVRSVGILFAVPSSFPQSNIVFANLTKIEINNARGTSVPGSCNVTLLDHGYSLENTRASSIDSWGGQLEENSGDLSRARRSVKTQEPVVEKIKRLDCLTSVCKVVQCAAGPFLDNNKFATFRLTANLNMKTLNAVFGKWDQISVVSEGHVYIRDDKNDIQPENHRPDNATVTMTVVHAGPPLPRTVAVWIIAVSVAAGVLLLLLILLFLIKIGFFRRLQHEKMKAMLQQATLKEWEPYLLKDDELQKAREAYDTSSQ